MLLCGKGSAIVVVSHVPVDQRRLSPGARKVKQTLPLIFGLGTGGGNDRLFVRIARTRPFSTWHPHSAPQQVPCPHHNVLCNYLPRLCPQT